MLNICGIIVYFTPMINLKLPLESSLTYLFIKLFVIIRETSQRISGMIMDANLNLCNSISLLSQKREKICPINCSLIISSVLQHLAVIHTKIHQFISYPSENRIPENATFFPLPRKNGAQHQQASQPQNDNFYSHIDDSNIAYVGHFVKCKNYI